MIIFVNNAHNCQLNTQINTIWLYILQQPWTRKHTHTYQNENVSSACILIIYKLIQCKYWNKRWLLFNIECDKRSDCVFVHFMWFCSICRCECKEFSIVWRNKMARRRQPATNVNNLSGLSWKQSNKAHFCDEAKKKWDGVYTFLCVLCLFLCGGRCRNIQIHRNKICTWDTIFEMSHSETFRSKIQIPKFIRLFNVLQQFFWNFLHQKCFDNGSNNTIPLKQVREEKWHTNKQPTRGKIRAEAIKV